MNEDFSALYAEIASCERCSLSKTRTNVVCGFGNEESDIVFVGEAPGLNEDKLGKPFVGAAGKLLTELLAGIGINREDVYIANVLKCRPPNNRSPLPEEIELCRPFLDRQLEIINPKAVCTMGNFATRAVLGREVFISKVRGVPVKMGKFSVFPLYHPAAALHRGDMREPLKEDFDKLREFLKSASKPEPEETGEPEQLYLW
jgi:uracil-DNA glycosylase